MAYSQPKGHPPAYESVDSLVKAPKSKWHPSNWSRLTILVVVAAVTIVIVALVVGAILGSKANAYPDYSAINYTLVDIYRGSTFFDDFDYFTGYDPSSGFVHYVDSSMATSTQYNLTYASTESAALRVDASETNASTGRYSVRITSKKQYNSGLFIFDVLNTPYGCTALWLTDPANWPENGEIDVMETVNQATTGNHVTLHTTEGYVACKMNAKRKETDSVLQKSCLNSTNANAGCGVLGDTDTAGQAFNDNGGGIYAMEWRDAGIRVWFFDRDSIPSDLP